MAKSGGYPRRSVRNFLLDARFQLRYTGMVIFVTVCVAATLGVLAYDYSQGQTEALTVQMLSQGDLSAETIADMREWAREEDLRVLLSIVGGILMLVLILGATGIVVTHRVVGPAFRLKQLLRAVEAGHYRVEQRLRKGDELQDVFDAFLGMTAALRRRSTELAQRLDDALTGNEDESTRWEVVREVRNELRSKAESSPPAARPEQS